MTGVACADPCLVHARPAGAAVTHHPSQEAFLRSVHPQPKPVPVITGALLPCDDEPLHRDAQPHDNRAPAYVRFGRDASLPRNGNG